MSPLARWLELLAPGAEDFVRGPFEALTLMPVYRVPQGCAPTLEGATFQCAEFSLRARGSVVEQARMMAALWAPWVRPGGVAAALHRLAPEATPELLTALEQLRADQPELDLLIGMDAGGAVRGKLYVMRATPDDPVALGAVAARALALVGVAPSWVRRSLDEMAVEPAFFALDLCGERASGGKLYFAFDQPAVVRAHLERLGADWLVERLDAVVQEVSDNPVGRWVITLRGRGDRTADVTLHAHLARLPPLSAPLEGAWERLRSLARAELGRELTPSYVSWMQAEQRTESLYYQVGLTPAELAPEVVPVMRGGRIRPNQGLDGGRAGPVYLSELDLAKLAQGAGPAGEVAVQGVTRAEGGAASGSEGGEREASASGEGSAKRGDGGGDDSRESALRVDHAAVSAGDGGPPGGPGSRGGGDGSDPRESALRSANPAGPVGDDGPFRGPGSRGGRDGVDSRESALRFMNAAGPSGDDGPLRGPGSRVVGAGSDPSESASRSTNSAGSSGDGGPSLVPGPRGVGDGGDPHESALRRMNAADTSGDGGPSRGPGPRGGVAGPSPSVELRPGPDGTPGGRRPGPDSRQEVPVPGPVGFPGFPRPRRTRPPGKEAP